MASGAKKRRLKRWFRQQCEQIKFSARGLVLSTKEKSFWAGFIPTFCLFGTLLNLLSGGFAAFNLIAASDFGGGIQIIWNAFLQTFGINRNFLDWLDIFLLALLQGLLIGILATIVKNTPKTKKQKSDTLNVDTSASIQNSGIIAILAVLGSGCPTCGTALLTPLLTAIFGSGVAMVGAISAILTWLAIVLALWTLKKLGYDAYVALTIKNLPRRAIIDKRSINE